MTFGVSTERDWSTGSEDGTEHIVSLHVWSKAAGLREAETIAAAIRAALHDQPLALDDHRLVNLRHEITDTRREAERAIHGVVRLRAVTEPLECRLCSIAARVSRLRSGDDAILSSRALVINPQVIRGKSTSVDAQ